MSMQEHPDDEKASEGFDRLFRKSAEEFEPPYDPAAWSSMNTRLDEHDRVIFWGKLLRWSLAGLALLVLFSASWYQYKKSHPKQVSSVTATKQELPAYSVGNEGRQPKATRTEQQPDGGALPEQPDRLADQPGTPGRQPNDQPDEPNPGVPADADRVVEAELREPKTGGAVTTRSLEPSESNRTEKTTNSTKRAARSLPSAIAGRQTKDQPMEKQASQRRRLSWSEARQLYPATAGNTAPDRQPKTNAGTDVRPKPASVPVVRRLHLNPDGANRENAGQEMSAIVPPVRAVSGGAESDSAQTQALQAATRNSQVDELATRNRLHWPGWTLPVVVVPTLDKAPAQPVASRVPQERGLSVRFAYSPDLSAIGLRNLTGTGASRPGSNIGLLAEYRFSNRWSIQTGVIRSTKVYRAGPDQYEFPSAWHWYVMPTAVDGRCDMLDIPVNVRFDIKKATTAKPGRVFVSAGTTTYVMLQERYDYRYANPNDPRIKSKFWAGKTGWYNFSQLNLSVGYERPINRRFAWQVAPFVQTPLKQVGFFKVNLLSAGAFLSVRYKLTGR